ncbi:rhodanese-like domain-containing protein [Gelidibacter salicanalis]|uniref:Rhodanese-like domain-containing protein n=1 Tax=Gelidibacter salicanalis TaxID=291193 RepID=A0A934NHR2_9FLAO|nr:rhodanese-like domain-containing protein [Gelidibacter salicanalis]MBJ7879194.1 rhodanese-like domain-containing protein [Gelidibacter salicanalis]
MISKLKEFLGIKPAPNYKQLLKEGGIIIDVRSKAEFAGGHIKGSKNIPLQTLNGNTNILKNKDTPIITCCASGMRSASAKSQLKSKGFTQVYNGGGWSSLNIKI